MKRFFKEDWAVQKDLESSKEEYEKPFAYEKELKR